MSYPPLGAGGRRSGCSGHRERTQQVIPKPRLDRSRRL